MMCFVETSVFTRLVANLMDDRHYQGLQHFLLIHPEVGTVITGSGGLRKIRWGRDGTGKSGGVRVIYYWDMASRVIFMLYIYPKNSQENLTAAQVKILKELVRRELA